MPCIFKLANSLLDMWVQLLYFYDLIIALHHTYDIFLGLFFPQEPVHNTFQF